jgi:hypothetical protein
MSNSFRTLKNGAFAICSVLFFVAAANYFMKLEWFGRFGKSVLGMSLMLVVLVIPWFEIGRRR